jgi:hypothetical protein
MAIIIKIKKCIKERKKTGSDMHTFHSRVLNFFMLFSLAMCFSSQARLRRCQQGGAAPIEWWCDGGRMD